MTMILKKLGGLAHEHRLVPFLGAGCSMGHVSVDWDGITDVMRAKLVNLQEGATNPEIAEVFIAEHGEPALADLLREHLLVDAFDDANGVTPLQVLGLELRSLYTTNQDNVMESAAVKYGRPLVVVSTLAHLAGAKPGDRILYKFHGDLKEPSTLVFSQSQYTTRIGDESHFMNVRLRSDLLAKNLLFIGYSSFRDFNIQKLFAEMEAQFSDSLPGSFLLAYRWSPELAELCGKHGVECIDPAKQIASPTGEPRDDLQEFLSRLCEETLRLSTAAELESMFRPKAPPPERWLIPTQLRAIEVVASNEPPANAIATFRGAVDLTQIPESQQKAVADALVEIIRRAPATLAGEIGGAFHNLLLKPAALWEPVAAYLALANRIVDGNPLWAHRPRCRSWPDDLMPLAAARAVELLESWGEPLTDGFYSRCSQWFDRIWQQLPDDLKQYVRPIIENAWTQKHTIYENPIARSDRLRTEGLSTHSSSFTEIHTDLIATFPKRFRIPYEK